MQQSHTRHSQHVWSYSGRSLSDCSLCNCSLSNCCNIGGSHSNYSHSDCTHSGCNHNSLSLAIAVTAVVIVVLLPSHSFLISRLKSQRLLSQRVYSHSSCTHTGFSLSRSSHSSLHAVVASRMVMSQSSFCHYKFWSQPTYSQRVQRLRL